MTPVDGAAAVASVPATTQVLVAGGGPVGLAAAVELGQRGIACVVVEPRAHVSHARPRCKTINVRSMEHLRRWGLADRLRARAPLSTAWTQDVVFCTSLAGRELSRFTGVFGLSPHGDRFPELGQQAPQYVLEELLRDAVGELPACTLLTGMRVIAVEQSATEVRVTVADQAGDRSVIGAEYLLGCDGPRSIAREAIGSAYVGELALRPNFGMLLRAPKLWDHVRHGPAVQYWIINPSTPALTGPIDLAGTWWVIAFGVDRETGERDATRIIDDIAGTPVQAAVVSTDPWTARMQLVDRARSGRVFLAGDAAHLNPPFGGHGLNTGLGDAVDLGWKLAAVLDGWGGPVLLDSYERERRPVQTRVIEEAAANMNVLSGELLADNLEDDDPTGDQARRLADARIQETKAAEFHSLDLVLGACYDDSPVVVADDATRSAQGDGGGTTARPGARVPHTWMSPGRSLYDELGKELTLLVLSEEGAASRDGLERVCRERHVELRTVNLSGAQLRDRYGADLVLVRPDQHVAWRGDRLPTDPSTLIDHVRGAGASGLHELGKGQR
jgi:2-polyprenyl-6-methoxyphenol hydroxylase-like FAD-dependent oxidoreductase